MEIVYLISLDIFCKKLLKHLSSILDFLYFLNQFICFQFTFCQLRIEYLCSVLVVANRVLNSTLNDCYL